VREGNGGGESGATMTVATTTTTEQIGHNENPNTSVTIKQ